MASGITDSKNNEDDTHTASRLPQPQCEVAIFWDYENVTIPLGYPPLLACHRVVAVATRYGHVRQRRVYADYSRNDTGALTMAAIAASGFDLVSTPRAGATKRKETLDRKLIADMILFAWDVMGENQKPCIVLITSDGDYAYTLNKLRDRGVSNVVVYRRSVAQFLTGSADVAFDLEGDVLLGLKDPAGENDAKGTSDLDERGAGDRDENDRTGGVHETVLQVTPGAGKEDGSSKRVDEEQIRFDALEICRLIVSCAKTENSEGYQQWLKVGPIKDAFVIYANGDPMIKAKPGLRFRLASTLAINDGWILHGKQRDSGKIVSRKGKASIAVDPISIDSKGPRGRVSNDMYLQLTSFGRTRIDPNAPMPKETFEF